MKPSFCHHSEVCFNSANKVFYSSYTIQNHDKGHLFVLYPLSPYLRSSSYKQPELPSPKLSCYTVNPAVCISLSLSHHNCLFVTVMGRNPAHHSELKLVVSLLPPRLYIQISLTSFPSNTPRPWRITHRAEGSPERTLCHTAPLFSLTAFLYSSEQERGLLCFWKSNFRSKMSNGRGSHSMCQHEHLF